MMNIQIEKKEDTIVCTITSLEYSNRECGRRNYMDTKRVRQVLTEGGHNPGDAVIEACVDNCDNKLEGVWVFEDNNSIKKEVIHIESQNDTPAKSRPSNRRKNSRKSKKVLDNSPKDVIIE